MGGEKTFSRQNYIIHNLFYVCKLHENGFDIG